MQEGNAGGFEEGGADRMHGSSERKKKKNYSIGGLGETLSMDA